MTFRQHHGQRLAAQGVQADGAVPRDFQAGEGKVDIARLQQRLGIATVDFAHPHGELGVVPVDIFDEGRHHLQERHGNRADVQNAAVAVGDFLHGSLQPLHLLGKFAHGGQDGIAGGGELGAAPRAFKQHHTQGLLELFDVFGERRLRHIQPFGGAPEVLFFGHGQKHPQMANEAEIYHLLSLSQASLSSILYIKKPVV